MTTTPRRLAPPGLLPPFRYQGPVLEPTTLRYSPHPDIIHPSVLATDARWERPLAPYYLYYAAHDAPAGICLALADTPQGPWREYEHNPLVGHAWAPHYTVSHVSSPHALWQPQAQAVYLYYHGENDTTRWAQSRDGVHFAYGGVAVTTAMFDPRLTEASYARVFAYAGAPRRGQYVMLLMGNLAGTRCVFQAWSADGRQWDAVAAPLLTPPPGYDQMGPGWVLPWQGRTFIIAFANRDDSPTFEPRSDLHLYEVSADFTQVTHHGLLMDHTVAGPDNQRINDPCLLAHGRHLYLYLNAGRRLHQHIALAVADLPATP